MKYDELELMELFLSEGKSLTDNYGDGQYIYRFSKKNMQLILFIYSYEKQINIFLQENNRDIFSVGLNNITQLKKEDMYLKILREDIEVAKICFGTAISVSVEA
ncbi:hypothetical protein [Isobaculum melis]|uniref:Uncharacterized protein n=1 Tax=Isobaculum melis TaxID=142588 RepID=A0A1H9U2C9_9LACT|nr:hypothetical protein [Isobaculum melis]SES03655.1 hypothetical protein SAMN04488559_12038 [Isobaculum melis]